MNKIFFSLILFIIIMGCNNKLTDNESIKDQLSKDLNEIDGDVALAFINLSKLNDTIFINTQEQFHAASTMKVPVMIELYKQAAAQKFSLQDSILLKNEFKSIVDGSLYRMDLNDDSDDILYNDIGNNVKIADLIFNMVTISSNLATNVLIDLVGAKNVTNSMRNLGANSIEVLRGVEDQKAYDSGLSNSTTANDLLVIMKAIATNTAGSKSDCDEMIQILKRQQFNDMIPLYLPNDVQVAHKTGSITGVHHDAAIVYAPNGNSYVLVLLSKNLQDFEKGTVQLAQISKKIYDYMME